MLAAWLGVLLVGSVAAQQPLSGGYAAHVAQRTLPGSCETIRAPHFGDMTYRFLGTVYPFTSTLPFRNGRFEDRRGLEVLGDPSGGPAEWETTLTPPEAITIGRTPAMLLRFFANHLRGSGSASQVLVLRCRAKRLEVVFEAGGEGVSASYQTGGELRVDHPVWRLGDSHAGPSLIVEESFAWDSRADRFGLARRSEREVRQPH
jgi:hypothetical protein